MLLISANTLIMASRHYGMSDALDHAFETCNYAFTGAAGHARAGAGYGVQAQERMACTLVGAAYRTAVVARSGWLASRWSARNQRPCSATARARRRTRRHRQPAPHRPAAYFAMEMLLKMFVEGPLDYLSTRMNQFDVVVRAPRRALRSIERARNAGAPQRRARSARSTCGAMARLGLRAAAAGRAATLGAGADRWSRCHSWTSALRCRAPPRKTPASACCAPCAWSGSSGWPAAGTSLPAPATPVGHQQPPRLHAVAHPSRR